MLPLAGHGALAPLAATGDFARVDPDEPAASRQPGIAVTRAGETMMRAVAVFVGRAVRGATPPSLPLGRLEAAEGVSRDLSPGGAIR